MATPHPLRPGLTSWLLIRLKPLTDWCFEQLDAKPSRVPRWARWCMRQYVFWYCDQLRAAQPPRAMPPEQYVWTWLPPGSDREAVAAWFEQQVRNPRYARPGSPDLLHACLYRCPRPDANEGWPIPAPDRKLVSVWDGHIELWWAEGMPRLRRETPRRHQGLFLVLWRLSDLQMPVETVLARHGGPPSPE